MKCIVTFILTIAMALGTVPLPFMPGSLMVYAADKTLSGSESYMAQDGDILTGSTSGTVTIADNANITLNNATISGGIVCDGSATITLVGTNSVTGFIRYDSNIEAYRRTAGIQIGGSGTTLTINGDGSLTANGAQYAAGIGLNGAWNVTEDVIGGNIVINGGNITANGGVGAAGIGAGFTKDQNNSSERKAIVGNITIKGGTVTAVGVTAVGGNGADGIGAGDNTYNATYQIGTVTIYDDIDKVDASSISESVTYMHDNTDVTANASNYFTITEDGDRRVITPKDDTDYTITIADGIEHGTLTGATTAKYMEKVTITATPALGYRFSRLVVKDAQNNDVESTANSFFMPKSNVTVSAVFEQGTHGTTEFTWEDDPGYGPESIVEKTIYNGVTTENLQQGSFYQIRNADGDYLIIDNDEHNVYIPYSGGTGTFMTVGTNFELRYDATAGFYDITMTDAGNGKWSVSILKTVGKMDDIPDQTYTGSEITPEPLVMAGSLSLNKGTDYVYSYTNNTDAGTATVRATFQGDYASLGYVEKEFNIIPGPEFKNHALLLTGQVGVQFFLELPAGKTSADYAGSYVTFSGQGINSSTHYDIPDSTAVINGVDTEKYLFTVNITSIQMADKITPTFHYTENGQEKTVVGAAYSAEDYIKWAVADDNVTGKNLDIVNALADYGHYAQIYLSQQNGWVIGTDHAEMKTYTTNSYNYNYVYFQVNNSAIYCSTGDPVASVNYRLYFDDTLSLCVALTPENGKTIDEVNVENAVITPTKSGDQYLIMIPDISATQLSDRYHMSVGDTQVQVSAMSYVYGILNSETSSSAAKDLVCALYYYGKACK